MSAIEAVISGALAGAKRRFLWTSVAVFVPVTAALFWRYAFAPGTTVSDPGDPLLLMWVMDWVQHALIHSPSALFDAPMFHPFTGTLAYSDPLLPQSLLTLPLRLLGLGPIAAYNAVFLGGIVCAGVLTSVLFLRITGDTVAALFGALVATFPALRLFHLAHMQLQFTAFWPLALLLVHEVLERPRARNAVALSATLVAAALASLYHGMFLALLLPLFALAAWSLHAQKTWRAPAVLVAAGVAAGAAFVPFARVHQRAIAHLAQERTNPLFSDLSDYFGISPFADLRSWLPGRVVAGRGPEWIGAAGGLLLPLAAIGIAFVAARKARAGSAHAIPSAARTSLPYVVLGCAALLLSLGPTVRWQGRPIAGNPFGYVTSLPGVREIRDFQRAGFVVALASGALVAVGLAELARHASRRVRISALAFTGLSTVVPSFSSSLPAYRPPPVDSLDPAYAWLERQPDSCVFFEAPLPRRGRTERFEYLWASLWHRKRMIHGFSGYLPLTDDTLRGESTGIHRDDFFRTLADLGANYLVVHTDELAAVPGGAASLVNLRERRGGSRVARFASSEIYRVDATPVERHSGPEGLPARVERANGGWLDPARNCIEVGPSTEPLVVYAPASDRLVGLGLIAEMPLGELDDCLRIESSSDLRGWTPVAHEPLLSTTLASYLEHPTRRLWTRAAVKAGSGSFVRLTSRRDRRLRFCDLEFESTAAAQIHRVPTESIRLDAHANRETAVQALDGDVGTRWSSAALQTGSEWMEIAFDRPREVATLVFELGNTPYDYGRRFAVDCRLGVSGDFETVSELDGRDVFFERPEIVQLLPVSRTCAAIKVRQIGTSPDNYWSIAEVAVFARP